MHPQAPGYPPPQHPQAQYPQAQHPQAQYPQYGQAHYPQPGSVPMGGPYAGSTAGIESIAKPTLALLGVRAALPLVYYFVPVSALAGDPRTGYAIKEGIRGLVTMAALVCFFIWFARVYSWIRQHRGGTRFSTGLAIGGWFIPFANFALPYMAVRDAWKRGANDENGFVVALWWLSYLAAVFIGMFYSVLNASPTSMLGGMGGSTMNTVFTLLSYTYILAQLGAFGLMFFIVQHLTKRVAAR